MDSKKAKSFMVSQGYDFNATQISEYTWSHVAASPTVKKAKAQIQITEKSAYMKDDNIQTGRGALTNVETYPSAIAFETVGRYKLYYSDETWAKIWIGVMTIFDQSSPVEYDIWSEYLNNIEKLNEFRDKNGTK